jgi:hypothetical protein
MAEFVIHVGKLELKFTTEEVKASTILSQAGADPATDSLEATKGESGQPEAEFSRDALVDLKKYKFFRVVPGGGGRASEHY